MNYELQYNLQFYEFLTNFVKRLKLKHFKKKIMTINE